MYKAPLASTQTEANSLPGFALLAGGILQAVSRYHQRLEVAADATNSIKIKRESLDKLIHRW